jgi:outer membrane lipoprotein-sorting protein
MKKTIFTIISLIFFSVGSAFAQDLQEILDKYFETAGQKKLLKLKTLVSSGNTQQMGMDMPFITYQKRPNMSRLEVEIQGTRMVMAYDGQNGWAIQPWTGSADPVDLSGLELRSVIELADLDGPLWDYKAKGHQLELVGTDELEGTKVYVLKLTRKDGDISTFYIDSEDFVALKMVNKTVVEGQEVKMEMYMSNYQDVDGIKYPFTTEQRMNGQVFMTINIEEVKFNEDIDDTLFLKPEATPGEKE